MMWRQTPSGTCSPSLLLIGCSGGGLEQNFVFGPIDRRQNFPETTPETTRWREACSRGSQTASGSVSESGSVSGSVSGSGSLSQSRSGSRSLSAPWFATSAAATITRTRTRTRTLSGIRGERGERGLVGRSRARSHGSWKVGRGTSERGDVGRENVAVMRDRRFAPRHGNADSARARELVPGFVGNVGSWARGTFTCAFTWLVEGRTWDRGAWSVAVMRDRRFAPSHGNADSARARELVPGFVGNVGSWARGTFTCAFT